MSEKEFEVVTEFVFKGKFKVKANSQAEANDKVRTDCAMVMGTGIHTTLNDRDVDWEFDTHPEKRVLGVELPTIQVLQHEVSYSYRDWDGEPDECDIEHLEKMIKEGYTSGELNTGEEEHSGWWSL